MCNLIEFDGQNFTLTDSTAATKAVVQEEPIETPTYTPEPRLTLEERRAKAFAGQYSFDDLFRLSFDGDITDAEFKQLQDEHKYIGEKF